MPRDLPVRVVAKSTELAQVGVACTVVAGCDRGHRVGKLQTVRGSSPNSCCETTQSLQAVLCRGRDLLSRNPGHPPLPPCLWSCYPWQFVDGFLRLPPIILFSIHIRARSLLTHTHTHTHAHLRPCRIYSRLLCTCTRPLELAPVGLCVAASEAAQWECYLGHATGCLCACHLSPPVAMCSVMTRGHAIHISVGRCTVYLDRQQAGFGATPDVDTQTTCPPIRLLQCTWHSFLVCLRFHAQTLRF
jgi:hypothetical protein